MKIIRLTDSRRARPVFVNVDAISYFQSIECTGAHEYTQLYMKEDPLLIKIEESPEQIIEIIKLTEEI